MSTTNILQFPAQGFQTYNITRRRDVSIKAACELVGCEMFSHGWQTTVDESTELGKAQAAYIRNESRRTFREMRSGPASAQLTVFVFEPGQRCFAEHRTQPETYLVRDGDFLRGNPTGRRRVHQRPADWVEDLGENQQRLKELRERG